MTPEIDARIVAGATPRQIYDQYAITCTELLAYVDQHWTAIAASSARRYWASLTSGRPDYAALRGLDPRTVRRAEHRHAMVAALSPMTGGAAENAAIRQRQKARREAERAELVAWERAGRPPMTDARRRELGLPPRKV